MALQFILGNSGSGKSHFLYQHIIEESQAHPDRNYLILVPEQFTMQTQKDLVSMHPGRGIINIDVLSFGRLAYRVFEEVGGDDRIVLDDEGKSLILRKIAGDYERELRVLGRNLRKPGYISEVKSVISELTQYGVDEHGLEELLGELNEESYLYWKLQDIQKIYRGFSDYLAERYITHEEQLDVLGSVAYRSKILKNAVIAMDGFTGFIPVQNKLLQRLMCLCRDMLITVEMDGRENPLVYRTPYQLFALSKEMVLTLTGIARESHVEIKDPVCLYQQTVYRFRQNAPMAFLEREIFRYTGGSYEGSQEAVRVFCARTVKQEVRYAASEIRYLLRKKGYRCRDIAIITADLGSYADELQRACEQYEIPLFVDYKRSILLNSFVEYLRSVLAMAEENFSYGSVFRYLRSGHSGFALEEIDFLENYVIAKGIHGYKAWNDIWIGRMKDMREGELEQLNGLRLRFLEQVEELTVVLKKRSKTVEEITRALYAFLVRQHLQEQIKNLEQRFQEEGRLEQAKEYAQIYRIVLDLFDKFVELLGDEKVSLREYCELLDAGLAEARVGVIPPGLDQVVAGDMQRTRLKQIKALFLLGANDTLIPGNGASGGFLSERDREVLGEKGVKLSPGSKEQNYIQKFYLYMNLTRPSERLYLSYARSGMDGSALRPAYLIQDFRRLFPKLSVLDVEGLSLCQKELSWESGFEELLEGLRDREQGLGDEWKELYSCYLGQEMWRPRVARAIECAFYRKEHQWIEKTAAHRLYGETRHPSVTRLEKFAACAYAHFLGYGLRLKEREEYEFESLDLGNVLHKALELFARKLKGQNKEWTGISGEERMQLGAECLRESIAACGSTVLFSTARDEHRIVRLERLLNRTLWALTEQLTRGKFRPSAFELNFEGGKIDRIDTCQAEKSVYVKVVDYKTGWTSFDISSVYHGLQLQLLIYLKAALDFEKRKNPGKDVLPAGILYYHVSDPFVEGGKSTEETQLALLRELKPDGLVNGSEEAIRLLDETLEKASDVIPVTLKNDGRPNQKSSAVDEEDFEVLMLYAREMAEKMEREMLDGNAQTAPYSLKNKKGCDYCAYRDICGFDVRLEGCRYRRLKAYDKEEALERMRKEL